MKNMNRYLAWTPLAIAWFLLLSLPAANAADPLDWYRWRGPEQNGTSRETGLIDQFDPRGGQGSNVLWKRPDLGGRSTPVVLGGRLYTIVRDQPGTAQEGEKVVCVDAATGEDIWEHRFNVYLSDVPDTRVGWSCVAADPETGRVYVQGVSGYFACLAGDTGKVVWRRSLHEEFGVLSTYGGRTNVPVVFEDLCIVSAVVIGWGDLRVPAHRFIAFDKATGEVVWISGTRLNPHDTTYSTPTVAVVDGIYQMIFGSGDGAIWSLEPRTGRPIWKYEFSRRGLNVSPLVVGSRVYSGHSEENIDGNYMGGLVAIDVAGVRRQGGQPADLTGKHLWRRYETMVGKAAPIMVDGKLVTIDDRAKLELWNPETGEKITREALGTVQRASPLYADGKIYTATNNGRWYILKLAGNEVETVHRLRLGGEAVDGSPIVSHGRLYLPTSENLYCLGVAGHQPQATSLPSPPKEQPGGKSVDHVQVVPAEDLLEPGRQQELQARVFNSVGQQLDTPEKVRFRADGPGEISADGKLTVAESAGHEAIYVHAQVGPRQGQSRLRIVPPLSWSFDFENGYVPITWVGMRNRHIVANEAVIDALGQNVPALDLYLFLTAQHTNADYAGRGGDTLKISQASPIDPWASLLEFMEQTQIDSVAEGRKFFDPLLKTLVGEKVVASWSWSSEGEPITLTVQRGPRGLEEAAVMVKLERIPVPRGITKLGTRSRGWCGPTDLQNYTIQCDVKGTRRNDKLPDMGLIAQGYALDLQGSLQKFEVRTWVTQRRIARDVDFSWKPGVWYTLKLQVAGEDGKAIVRGKAWPRDQQEPAQWHVTAVDASPNTAGSPGFYGNARDAIYMIDNVTVAPNSQVSAN